MALQHTTAIRDGLANYIATQAAAGTTNPTPQLVLETSGGVEVATLNMSVTPYGAASGGSITAAAISPDTDATGGTVARFRVLNRDGTEVYRGTVTAVGGGGDLELSSLAIGAGDTVSVSSLIYSAPV